MMPRRSLIVLILLCLLASPALAGRALVISDLHFDPFADSSLIPALLETDADGWAGVFASGSRALPGYGAGSTPALVDSALAAMTAAEPSPDLVLCPGDLLRHNFRETYAAATGDHTEAGVRAFVLKTVRYLTGRLADAFPGVPVVMAIGNNDGYAGDYALEPSGDFLADTAGVYAALLPDAADSAALAASWPRGGWGLLSSSAPDGLGLLVLSTTFFSVNNPADSAALTASAEELAWIEESLARAESEGRKLLVLQHIPVGVDVFGSLHDAANADGTLRVARSFWRSGEEAAYLASLRAHPGAVAGVLTGHTHMDDYRLVPDSIDGPAAAGKICPALAPVFGNNPGFLQLDLTPEAIAGFTTWALDISAQAPAWRAEYSSSAYGAEPLTPTGLRDLLADVLGEARDREAYALYYDVGRGRQFGRNFNAFWCGAATPEADAFLACWRDLAGRGGAPARAGVLLLNQREEAPESRWN